MFQFITACLLSLAAGAPSKLGGHHAGHRHSPRNEPRQGRGSSYIAPADQVQEATSVVEARVAAPH